MPISRAIRPSALQRAMNWTPGALDAISATINRRRRATSRGELVGYQDLDQYGSWRNTPDYGAVWVPNGTPGGWAPYHYGHWLWVDPWGWTWVDDAPWGFAPFHYGRWAYVGDYLGLGAWAHRGASGVRTGLGGLGGRRRHRRRSSGLVRARAARGLSCRPIAPVPFIVTRVNVTNTVIVNNTCERQRDECDVRESRRAGRGDGRAAGRVRECEAGTIGRHRGAAGSAAVGHCSGHGRGCAHPSQRGAGAAAGSDRWRSRRRRAKPAR